MPTESLCWLPTVVDHCGHRTSTIRCQSDANKLNNCRLTHNRLISLNFRKKTFHWQPECRRSLRRVPRQNDLTFSISRITHRTEHKRLGGIKLGCKRLEPTLLPLHEVVQVFKLFTTRHMTLIVKHFTDVEQNNDQRHLAVSKQTDSSELISDDYNSTNLRSVYRYYVIKLIRNELDSGTVVTIVLLYDI